MCFYKVEMDFKSLRNTSLIEELYLLGEEESSSTVGFVDICFSATLRCKGTGCHSRWVGGVEQAAFMFAGLACWELRSLGLSWCMPGCVHEPPVFLENQER